MGMFEASVYKVNALGYWKLEEEPLEFDFDDENKKVNVKVKGNEVGRNDIQFGAGYSELDGFFIQGQFNTRNFLGRGNSLGLSLQFGKRTDLYSLSYTEPYFLDRRILLGGSIFKNAIDYTQAGFSSYQRETTGITMSMGLGVGPFSSVSGVIAFPGRLREVLDQQWRPVSAIPPPAMIDRSTFLRLTAPPTSVPSRSSAARPTRSHRFRTRTLATIHSSRVAARRCKVASVLPAVPFGGDFDYVRPELHFTQLRRTCQKEHRGVPRRSRPVLSLQRVRNSALRALPDGW